MDGPKQINDFQPLTIDQIRDPGAVREDFGDELSQLAFTERLLMLLEDIRAHAGRA
ncbi:MULTISPECIES: hypothetical protein [Burkholderia cepacia complex]|uniref:hypothetical protein n=1 Tax=Burkholderia cepacia complex TaxID=87882 RepID=UPI0015838B69|nr:MULTISPECIES: hypothetical protein [Burkholderia cepacia complex]